VAELADQAGATVEDRVQALAQKAPVKLVDALFDTAMAAAPKDQVKALALAYAAAQASGCHLARRAVQRSIPTATRPYRT